MGPDPWIRALVQFGLGYERQMGGQVSEAEQLFAAALAGFRAIGERWGTGMSLAELAALAEGQGDRERSVALIPGIGNLSIGQPAADRSTKQVGWVSGQR